MIAVVWMVFTTIVFFFPTSPNPDAAGMNYTIVVLGGVLLLSLVYYHFPVYGGKYWFEGPLGAVKRLEEENRQNGEELEIENDEKRGNQLDVIVREAA